MRKHLPAFIPFLLLIAAPLLLRPKVEERAAQDAQERLVILSPHMEAIRYEFEHAFVEHYKKTTGKTILIDWRTPGGASDIVRFIDDQYTSSFRRYWQGRSELGPWANVVSRNFNNRKLKMDDPDLDPRAKLARETFLKSDVGIGVDLFFGGGQYDMNKQAEMGHAVDAGIQKLHPHWFCDDVIPATFSGEVFYDKQGRYYGTCLSAFGICYNVDRLNQLDDKRIPNRWEHLGEPRFYQQAAIADPTKSGSITKCFEMLIQQQLHQAWKLHGDKGKNLGWANGLNLIKRIGGNARYITDSASKVPRDVAAGNATVGICIDFYGRTESEWSRFQTGDRERIVYVTPIGGSSISADPIQLLRGAPNRKAAVAFIEFVLSPAGQKIWNYRPGTPGGPLKQALRRLPLRKDMYAPEHLQYMADAGVDPFKQQEEFVYHGGWTDFSLIRKLIKCMVIDASVELRDSWGAIVKAGGPDKVPQAMAAFNALPFEYDGIAEAKKSMRPGKEGEGRLNELRTLREWSDFFRKKYAEAKRLAEDVR